MEQIADINPLYNLLQSSAPESSDDIMSTLMRQYCIEVPIYRNEYLDRNYNTPERNYRIIEAEYYLRSEEHPDPYVHCAPDQANVCTWYLHKAPKQFKSFRAGTFSGLDITFGRNAANDKDASITYGGILIRSLIRLSDDTTIEGPCNCVRELMSAIGIHNNISGFGEIIAGQDVFMCAIKLSRYDHADNLQQNEQGRQIILPTIYTSRRVGLNRDKYQRDVNGETLPSIYWDAPYRYVMFPNRIHKERKSIIDGMITHHLLTREECDAIMRNHTLND